MNLTTSSTITISGILTTSGRGPTQGPGVPIYTGVGAGGSYGGSGGMNTCNTSNSFSVVSYQVITIFFRLFCERILFMYW